MTLQCCVFLESLVQAMLKKKVDGYVNEIGDVLLNRVIILVVTSHGPFSRRPKSAISRRERGEGGGRPMSTYHYTNSIQLEKVSLCSAYSLKNERGNLGNTQKWRIIGRENED
jgi:hypothetical protein